MASNNDFILEFPARSIFNSILADNDSSSADQQLCRKRMIVLARTSRVVLGLRSAGVQVLEYKVSWPSPEKKQSDASTSSEIELHINLLYTSIDGALSRIV
jgi:hypothetical protein